jgi:hypothetical protein
LRKLVTGLEKADGAGQKMASTMNQGLNAQIKQMQSAFEGLAIAIGDTGLLTGITQIVTMFAGLVSKVAQLPPPVLKVVTIAAMVLAILPPLVIGIGSVITAVQSIGTVIPIISAFAAGLSIVPVLVGAAIGVIANLGYQIYKNWDFIRTLSWGEIGYAIVESFKEGVSLALGGLWGFISGHFDGVIANLRSITWYDIGSNLVETLTQGIYNAIPGLNTAMSITASAMDAFLPHSPAKVGALSRLGEVGGGLIGEISSGITKNIPGLQSTLDSGLRVAAPKVQAITGSVGQAVGSVGQAVGGAASGVTFNITIQGNVTQSTLQELKNNLREFHAIMKDGARRYGTV